MPPTSVQKSRVVLKVGEAGVDKSKVRMPSPVVAAYKELPMKWICITASGKLVAMGLREFPETSKNSRPPAEETAAIPLVISILRGYQPRQDEQLAPGNASNKGTSTSGAATSYIHSTPVVSESESTKRRSDMTASALALFAGITFTGSKCGMTEHTGGKPTWLEHS